MTKRTLETAIRLLVGAMGLGLLAVPLLNPVGWEPLIALMPAALCVAFAVFGWED